MTRKHAKIGSSKSKDSYRQNKNGETIKPVLYVGAGAGHGTYMAGAVDGVLVVDKFDKPIQYSQIPNFRKKEEYC